MANPSEQPVVREFFELFKTPWEFYQNARQYEVVLCTGDARLSEITEAVVLIYAGNRLAFDIENQIPLSSERKKTGTFSYISYKGFRIPIYGDNITFRKRAPDVLVDEGSPYWVCLDQPNRKMLARVGYDLFHEVDTLLTEGQPPANASIPALELHIAVLRDLIVAGGVTLLEIPPIPHGHRFIACLTHDVDHPAIRQHKFDHTMFGFLYRAVLGSLISALRGRTSIRRLLANWAAAVKLLFVHLGIAKDFWQEFDRYAGLENGLRSSFFIIPIKDYPGQSQDGPAPRSRASRYGASDVVDQIRKLISVGCEIGLHGIDAWLDSSKGHEELEQIRRITGTREIGVRMHWLYFSEDSPVILERAGVDYDSTIGYNETVGYRAGTTQVYKPLAATRLLELPLHVMDTALFFRSYLDLSPNEARQRVDHIIDNATLFGGTVTVNWHDRSIAPERLWGDFYLKVVEELKSQGAWFSTAGQAVTWFRKRRSASFKTIGSERGVVHVKVATGIGSDLPALRLRVHKPGEPYQDTAICDNALVMLEQIAGTKRVTVGGGKGFDTADFISECRHM